MRAGLMDSVIDVQRATRSVNANGTPSETWTTFVSLRAQVLQQVTEEFIRGSAGASDETTVVFRTWWHHGITLADRILFDGTLHNIKEIKPIGRRAGLEIRTFAKGAA